MLQRVFVDANVLVSRTTRDWLILLRNETDQMFQLHSTIDVVVEAVRTRRRQAPTADGEVTHRLFHQLTTSLDEILQDYDGDIDFEGNDPDDAHVHAAAVASRADILLTSNGRDFGDADLLPYEIYTPDEFFLLVDDSAPEQVRRVTLKQVKYWEAKKHRGENVKPLNVALADAGCNEFATRVRLHLQTLAGPRKPRHK